MNVRGYLAHRVHVPGWAKLTCVAVTVAYTVDVAYRSPVAVSIFVGCTVLVLATVVAFAVPSRRRSLASNDPTSMGQMASRHPDSYRAFVSEWFWKVRVPRWYMLLFGVACVLAA